MDRWIGKIALITGASGGVGAALATQLVKKGMIVVGLARRVEKIDDLKIDLKNAPGKLYSLKADITKDEDIIGAFDWVKKNLGSLHVLVNNAGTMNLGRLTDGDPAKWRHIFNVNVLGLSVCTKSAFQLMNESGVNDGHIFHINSIAGHSVPVYEDPRLNVLNVYPASKFAVTALTETLRRELSSVNSKIKVTSISPGFVKTDFALNAAGEMDEDIKDFIRNRPGLKADDVVDAILYALSTPPNVQIQELILTPI